MITTPLIKVPFQGPAPKPQGERDTPPSILIVEDEPSICRAIAIALTRAGYNPVTTTSGDGAGYYLRTQYFHAMLIDLRIPDMRGDAIFRLAISIQPQLRKHTLFTTGDVTEHAAELIEACGCQVLMKPFDLKDLTASIAEILRDEGSDEDTSSLKIVG